MKTGELSKRLDVAPSTIRFWASEYSSYLSESAIGLGKGASRVFSERDVKVLATVAQMRDQGLTHEQIVDALEGDQFVEHVPSSPAREEITQQPVTLVSIDQLHRALDQVQFLQMEIDRLIEERDLALITRDRDVSELNKRIAQLQGELGRAEGKLAMLERERKPFDYWLRVMVVVILAAVTVTAVVVFLLASMVRTGG
jgi:DNA-binding transcriptional MerR regulator